MTALLFSCRTAMPPERPVAYLFPTVRTIRSLQSLTPLTLTRPSLDAILSMANLKGLLEQSGMLDMDYDVILRGLSQKGFAEVDARRASMPFRWLTVSSLEDGVVELMACYHRNPPENLAGGLQEDSHPTVTAVNSCLLSSARPVRMSSRKTDTMKIELLEQRANGERLWIQRWQIRPERESGRLEESPSVP